MFKSLLRTIPTLSGNISLACYATDIYESDDSNTYECFIQQAAMIPLQNTLYDKILGVNLLTSSWEHDVSRFYGYYNNYFYEENFSFDTTDYQKLDLTNQYPQDTRNRDNEFGCKRSKYSQNNYQFNFYAPIYIDNVNSLPDYFLITIKFDNKRVKKLKIKIAEDSDNKYNYLYTYLKNYVSQIDDKVVFLLQESNQGTYYGINVRSGGFASVKDNVIGTIYNNQLTMNNFDNTICNGFKRNEMIMRQVIPLTFMFNITDLLNYREIKTYNAVSANIKGKYYTNNIANKFYDFSIDYTDFTQKLNTYQSYKKLASGDSENIMDVTFPSLDEMRFYKYKYTNKLTPMYTRWKLKYSDDTDPYITNANFAFSYINKTTNYQYGNYPIFLNSVEPEIDIDENNTQNVVLPTLNDDMPNYQRDYFTMLNNHTTEWFNIVDDVFDAIHDDKLWENVSDNQVYYNGILYNLNSVVNSSSDDLQIDKFAVLLKPDMDIQTVDEASRIIESKYCISYSSTASNALLTGVNNTSPLFSYTTLKGTDATFENTCLFTRSYDYNNSTKKYVIVDDYYNLNRYYSVDEIGLDTISQCYLPEYKSYADAFITYSYELLPMRYTTNMFTHKIELNNQEKINNLFAYSDYTFYDYAYNEISEMSYAFRQENSYVNDWMNIYPNGGYDTDVQLNYPILYCSHEERYDKVPMNSTYQYFMNNLDATSYDVFLSKRFIAADFIKDLDCSAYQPYNYIPDFVDNTHVNSEYYEKTLDTTHTSYLFVDSFSLNKYIYGDNYNRNANAYSAYNIVDYISIKESSKYDLSKEYSYIDTYARFINKEHIQKYRYLLHQDQYNTVDENIINDPLSYIYSKHRYAVVDERINDITLKDEYVDINTCLNQINPELASYDPISKFNLFLSCLSDTVDDDCNMFTFKYAYNYAPIDLYFYKRFFVLNDELYQQMIDADVDEITPLNIYTKVSDYKDWTLNIPLINVDDASDTLVECETALMPLVDTIYCNSQSQLNIQELFSCGKVTKHSGRFIYSEYSYDCFIEASDAVLTYNATYNLPVYDKNEAVTASMIYLDNTYNYSYTTTYTYYTGNTYTYVWSDTYGSNCYMNEKRNGRTFETITYENVPIGAVVNRMQRETATGYETHYVYSYIDESLVCSYDIDYNLNLVTNTDNGKNYAFYLFNVSCANNRYSFNIHSDEALTFNKVNNVSLDDNVMIFKYIMPYLSQSVWKYYASLATTMVKPSIITLSVKYQPYVYDTGNTLYSYKYNWMKTGGDFSTENFIANDIMFVNSSKKTLKLNRYLNYITPLITETSTVRDSFNLKYKSIDKTIDESNISKHTLNIYKYEPIRTINRYDSKLHTIYEDDFSDEYEYEYKYFNDNKLYNLEPEFTITLDNAMTYTDLLYYETTQITLQYFTTHINKDKIHKFSDNEILFLFNKYKVNYISKPYKLDAFRNVKLYTLKYNFILV